MEVLDWQPLPLVTTLLPARGPARNTGPTLLSARCIECDRMELSTCATIRIAATAFIMIRGDTATKDLVMMRQLEMIVASYWSCWFMVSRSFGAKMTQYLSGWVLVLLYDRVSGFTCSVK
jgi:hypothetical protein